LLHEPQMHPVKQTPVHADFYVVKMNEKLQTEIPLHFEGESEAVTVLDGTLSPQLDALNVECFPDKLVPSIEVDITALKTLEDILRVSDIKVPEGIEVLNDPEEVVITITPPRTEEELAALEEEVGEAADEAAVGALEVSEEKAEEEGETANEETKETKE
jgi:large subunit ribosomal protein L25